MHGFRSIGINGIAIGIGVGFGDSRFLRRLKSWFGFVFIALFLPMTLGIVEACPIVQVVVVVLPQRKISYIALQIVLVLVKSVCVWASSSIRVLEELMWVIGLLSVI